MIQEFKKLLRREILRELLRKQLYESLSQAKTYVTSGKLTSEELQQLIAIDPTKQKKYLGWMAKKWIDVGKTPSDLTQLKQLIPTFDTFVNKNKIDTKDINSFKSIKDLADKIDVIQSTGEHISTSELEKDVETILSNKDLLIMSPHTHEASRKLGLTHFAFRKCKGGGLDSAWCTTYKTSDHWDDYYYAQDVTFYYVKVTSTELMEKLKELFPKRYDKLVVMAFAVIPMKKMVIDAYDGKDKQIKKSDIKKIVDALGIEKYLVATRVGDERQQKYGRIILTKIKKYVADGSEGDLTINNYKGQLKLPEMLTVVKGDLDISSSPGITLPSSLKKVTGRLDIPDNMTKLPEGLTSVGSLDGSNLTELPDNIQCNSLEIRNLTKFPSSLQVKRLNIFSSPLKSIPKIKGLQRLDIVDSKIEKLPDNFEIKELRVASCDELEMIPTLIGNQELEIVGCKKLKALSPGTYKSVFISQGYYGIDDKDEAKSRIHLPDGIKIAKFTGLSRIASFPKNASINVTGGYFGHDSYKISPDIEEIGPNIKFIDDQVDFTIPDGAKLKKLPKVKSFDTLHIGSAPNITLENVDVFIDALRLDSKYIESIPSTLRARMIVIAKNSAITSIPREVLANIDKLTVNIESTYCKILVKNIPGVKEMYTGLANDEDVDWYDDDDIKLRKIRKALGMRRDSSFELVGFL